MSPVTATLDCVIGLGANLGNREQALAGAVQQLRGLGEVVCLSNLYENPAVGGGPPQPDFVNGAVRLRTPLLPLELLDKLLRVELLAGRERLVKWGPRTLDLDLLWIDGVSVDLENLKVPHPRLLERAFALLPLVEVAPNARCPKTGRDYATALNKLGTAGLRLVAAAAGPSWQLDRQRPTDPRPSTLRCPEPGLSNPPER